MFSLLVTGTGQNLLHPSDKAVCQTDLDSPGVKCGAGQQVFNHPLSQFARTLILFQYDQYVGSGFNIIPSSSVHRSLFVLVWMYHTIFRV